MNSAEFLQARITATQAQIVAYEDAALAIGEGAVESYMLDTGQTQQKVTKLNVAVLQKAINSLYNRCATLEARLNGSGSITVRPYC